MVVAQGSGLTWRFSRANVTWVVSRITVVLADGTIWSV